MEQYGVMDTLVKHNVVYWDNHFVIILNWINPHLQTRDVYLPGGFSGHCSHLRWWEAGEGVRRVSADLSCIQRWTLLWASPALLRYIPHGGLPTPPTPCSLVFTCLSLYTGEIRADSPHFLSCFLPLRMVAVSTEAVWWVYIFRLQVWFLFI